MQKGESLRESELSVAWSLCHLVRFSLGGACTQVGGLDCMASSR